RAKRGEPKPEPVADEVLFKRVDSLLLAGVARQSPTAQARALFTKAEIAALRKNEALKNDLLGQIAAKFAPEQLPPGILGKVGDTLLALGQPELAKKFYEQIITAHPKSIFADFGFVGLGEIALLEGNADEALSRFNAAIDVAGARFKLKEATLGRARAHLLAGRLDAAQKLYEEVAGNRAWRGEATAESLFQLGEIASRRGTAEDLAKAQAHYQRVYLGYKRFDLWVARAYIRSAETFVKLKQPFEALTTVNRFFTFREQFEKLPEWRQAQALYDQLKDTPPPPAASTSVAAAPATS
nr:tetratricopeptide repeat protein [Opitutaceae bacterium]